MKLEHLIETNEPPTFAWLEPARGPEDIRGVRLAYIQSIKRHYEEVIQNAKDQEHTERVTRLEKQRDAYIAKGQEYFTPDFGWWWNEQKFFDGEKGFNGSTRGKILHKFPNLRIVSSRKEAVKAAKEAGII